MEDEAARPEQKFNVIKSGGKRGGRSARDAKSQYNA